MELSMLHGYRIFLVIMVSFYKSKVMMFDSRLSPPMDLHCFHGILYMDSFLEYTS